MTSRGIFQMNRSSGKVTNIFRGVDLASGGGRLAIVGDRLVAVTTQSVTSYATPPAETPPPTQKGSQ
jgi:hypothetical protein